MRNDDMSAKYTVLKNGKITLADLNRQFSKDILRGLSLPVKALPCKYIYDENGSQLFCRIMELPEYYLTRCETELLEMHKGSIGSLIVGERCNLVELGAGDGKKTKILLEQFLTMSIDFQYCPVDISESAVKQLASDLNERFPVLEMNGLVSDYFDGLRWLSEQNHSRNVVLFLGSSIGNFSSKEAETFLMRLHDSLNNGDLVLIGFDLKKADIGLILRAYNDASGVTEQFNLNILRRINGELGGNFDTGKFRYLSTWDTESNAVKSFLVSTCDQIVYIEGLDRSFRFKPGERIHTESSHKFSEHELSRMAEETGFDVIRNFHDSRKYFANTLWKVRKEK
jgi:dimethylhistidine N-methyltransferase